MGKLFTPEEVLSGFQTTNTLNTNFQNLEAALDKTLSRTGEVPNEMLADLDMNSYDIINVANIIFDSSLKDPKVITGNYTLVRDDKYRVLRVEATAVITLPDDEALFRPGWYCHVQKATDGFVTFQAAGDGIMEAVGDSNEILEKWGFVTLYKLIGKTWAISGNLA